jgi:hypothetical protein
MEDFEVIEIVDGTTHYPTLLGLYWAFDNQAIINPRRERSHRSNQQVLTPSISNG